MKLVRYGEPGQEQPGLIDAQGVLREEWRGIKVAGHVDEVLKAVKALKQA